jgi:hypothetical protein
MISKVTENQYYYAQTAPDYRRLNSLMFFSGGRYYILYQIRSKWIRRFYKCDTHKEANALRGSDDDIGVMKINNRREILETL